MKRITQRTRFARRWTNLMGLHRQEGRTGRLPANSRDLRQHQQERQEEEEG